MNRIGRIALVALAVALVAGLAVALIHSGAGTWASGNSAGTENTKSFSLGSGYAYSVTSVTRDEAKHLQSQGVQVITVPASKAIYVTSQAGKPLDIKAGDRSTLPNVIVFGPGGFVGTGVWPGSGTPLWTGTGTGAGASVTVGQGSVSVNAAPGAEGISIDTGPNTIPTQVYSFNGNAGDTYLVTQQYDGKADRVLVTFQ